LCDAEKVKIKWSLDLSTIKVGQFMEPVHGKGVQTWDWSSHNSMFATGGIEHTVHLWSPFVNKRVGFLQHPNYGSSIHKVLFNESANQLITLEGTHKRVRVWDIRMQRCLVELEDNQNQDSAFMSMSYDTNTQKIVTGGCRPQMYVKPGIENAEEHDPYIAVAVCEAKNLIAAVDDKNKVFTYRVGSGRHIFAFEACPRDEGVVTALTFDWSSNRLLVGCNNGRIRLFNYGNGHLLKQYQLKGSPEVSGAKISLGTKICNFRY